jgi:hypothetical protein
MQCALGPREEDLAGQRFALLLSVHLEDACTMRGRGFPVRCEKVPSHTTSSVWVSGTCVGTTDGEDPLRSSLHETCLLLGAGHWFNIDCVLHTYIQATTDSGGEAAVSRSEVRSDGRGGEVPR